MRDLLATITLLALLTGCTTPMTSDGGDDEFTVMAWNILHGGRDDGLEVGPQRVIDVIRDSGADVIAMQETYGSGELISGSLGYHFHPRGTNLSVHSRFPIGEDISVHEAFKCVGAVIELPDGRRLAMYSIWLPYGDEIWAPGTRDGKTTAEILATGEPSRADIQAIIDGVAQRVPDHMPVIIAGDFNCMSHLDYTEAAADQYGHVIDWPTSRVMTNAGFTDAYRAMHPDVNRRADRTWTPRSPEQEEDRIDFVYVRGLEVLDARHIDTHAVKFPSDHSAVVIRVR